MSTREPALSPRLAKLFVVALTGALVVVGIALASLGWAVLAPYLLLVVLGFGVLVRRARVLRAHQHEQHEQRGGRTCGCCTSTVFDPVEIR
jgi:uncharacterized membrane protein YoaK (UPF0700 family)